MPEVHGVEVEQDLLDEAKNERRHGVKITGKGLVAAMNREARRAESKNQKEPEAPAPIIVPKQVSQSEAVDRSLAELYVHWNNELAASTMHTLQGFLEAHEARILEEAWVKGKPLPKEVLRQALANIYQRGERARALAAQRRK